MVAFAKFYPWAFLNTLELPFHTESGASPFYPGLEVFYALDNATQNKKPIHYMGGVINESTLAGLAHERRMNLIPQIWRKFKIKHNYHSSEISDLKDMIAIRGIENLSEHLDDEHMALLVYHFNKTNPYQKPIMIDNENERLFKHIYENMEGKSFDNKR